MDLTLLEHAISIAGRAVALIAATLALVDRRHQRRHRRRRRSRPAP